MRIVGGIYKRRLITYPDDSSQIRPTKDRIREAIFSALNDITDLKGLDLYSGSGAMGVEALSRGCSHVTFVDNYKLAVDTTKKNLQSLNITNYDLLFCDDMTAINKFIKENKQFDIIFLDPPYKKGKYEELVGIFLSQNLLSENGIIVMESDRNILVSEKEFKKIKEYKYGDIKVYILWR